MERATGRMLDGDEVLHENVEITLNLVESPSGHKHYEGVFHIPLEQTGLLGEGPFRLELGDGRVGMFSVSRLVQQPSDIEISFSVDGALR
jgi:hypothetical protein